MHLALVYYYISKIGVIFIDASYFYFVSDLFITFRVRRISIKFEFVLKASLIICRIM